jgi:long-chain fatty acid transport protein
MKVFSLLAIVLGGFLPSSAYAAGYANTAQSATSTAMGGVGVANPDEPNASYYNPAAMTERNGFNVYVGPTVILPSVEYTGPAGKENTETPLLYPPNLHISIPFGDVAVGVGATFPYGLTMQWPDEWSGRGVIRKQMLTTLNINPNLAYRFREVGLSVAVGGQMMFSSVELERNLILRSDREVKAHIGGTGKGYGVVAAALYRPDSMITMGLQFRSGTTIDYAGSAHFDGAEGTPFATTFVDQNASTEITLPHTVTTGLGVDLGDIFVSVDGAFTGWSSNDRIELAFSESCPANAVACDGEAGETNPPTSIIKSEWTDSMTFRLGLEYTVADNLPLRLGFAYDVTPIPPETVSPSLPGNDRKVLTAGFGYTLGPVRADAGYMLVMAERKIENGNNDGTYATTASLFAFNLGYELD